MVEAVALCPALGDDAALPGEEYHEVGQNPRAGSSIAATQHTQVTGYINLGFMLKFYYYLLLLFFDVLHRRPCSP